MCSIYQHQQHIILLQQCKLRMVVVGGANGADWQPLQPVYPRAVVASHVTYMKYGVNEYAIVK